MFSPWSMTRSRTTSAVGAAAITVFTVLSGPVFAQVTAFKQAVAQTAAQDEDIAAFYRDTDYAPVWTGPDASHRDRRAELLRALANARSHGLPEAKYDSRDLLDELAEADTAWERGVAEVALTKAFLEYARDIQTGILIPSRVDSAIKREVPYRDRRGYLEDLSMKPSAAVFRSLPPRTLEYNALLKEKLTMERLLARGGWGAQVPSARLERGDSGSAVVALRNRLIAMGYLSRSNTQDYDAAMEVAVMDFQRSHGLAEDGIAGDSTLAQINKTVAERLQSIVVALERERWLNVERGARHILVNIPDFTAKIIDDGKLTFMTRSVVGARQDDRPTPEFSDVMEHMVINPSWYVPRSIVTKEYLPVLQRNPYALQHMEITDRRGRRVNRGSANFRAYSARSFPYSMRQPPSNTNALGLVKFMFPNKYNIYLHDTPAKSLFDNPVRAFSHGCVRLAEPFEFAYALLAKQTSDPEGFFKSHLNTGREAKVNLETPVPVHLIYRTAFTNARGVTEYREDVYGRDARIWDALSREGVTLGGVQG